MEESRAHSNPVEQELGVRCRWAGDAVGNGPFAHDLTFDVECVHDLI